MVDISQTTLSNAFSWMQIYEFWLIFHWSLFLMVQINNIPILVQIMAWRRPGDKPFTEPMRVRSPTHICVTRPQWAIKIYCCRFLAGVSAPCIARLSATMELIMQHQNVIISHVKGYQPYLPSQCWDMRENEIYYCVPRWNSARHALQDGLILTIHMHFFVFYLPFRWFYCSLHGTEHLMINNMLMFLQQLVQRRWFKSWWSGLVI